MHEKLEKYLEEIGRHLAAEREKEEILAELRSHILEKTARRFGEINDANLERIIQAYGTPRQVAEKYMEGSQIIAPGFKAYLIRYTLILFAFHFGCILLSLIFKTSLAVLPFFYIPRIDNFQALFYVPMAFVFDLGLVGIILYFVTQSRKDVRLPWPKLRLDWKKIAAHRRAGTRPVPLILLALGYAVLVWIYLRFDTLFFETLDFHRARPLLTPAASKWYSLALLVLLGIGIAAYALRIFVTSEWVSLVRSALQLGVLGVAVNRPFQDPFSAFPHFDLRVIAGIITVVTAAWIAVDFLTSLILLAKGAGAR